MGSATRNGRVYWCSSPYAHLRSATMATRRLTYITLSIRRRTPGWGSAVLSDHSPACLALTHPTTHQRLLVSEERMRASSVLFSLSLDGRHLGQVSIPDDGRHHHPYAEAAQWLSDLVA